MLTKTGDDAPRLHEVSEAPLTIGDQGLVGADAEVLCEGAPARVPEDGVIDEALDHARELFDCGHCLELRKGGLQLPTQLCDALASLDGEGVEINRGEVVADRSRDVGGVHRGSCP